jgi:hypothetical protein
MGTINSKNELAARTYKGGGMTIVSSVLLIMMSHFFCDLAYGQTFKDKCEKIKDELKKTPFLKEFADKLDELIRIKEKAENLVVSVAAGYNGDVSRHDNRQLINLDTVINKEIYPIAFRFNVGAVFSTKNKESQDQVTTFLVNFDYNVTPWLKTYGFVERFTDTFMNIKERYETGVGAELELNLFDPTNKINNDYQKLRKERESIENMPCQIKILRESLSKEDTQKSLSDAKVDTKELSEFMESLATEAEKLKKALKKNRTRLNLGFAVTVMSEMEQPADLSTDVLDIMTQQKVDTYNQTFDPTQRFRIVFRPSIKYKIDDHLSLYYHIYFKEPLGSPMDINGKRDWRSDSRFDAKFDFLKDTSWGGEASIYLEYQRHYDNAPPEISSSIVANYVSKSEILKRTVTDNRHDVVLIKIGVKF